MKTLTMTKGLPGSGKSTWALEVVAANPGQYKRINKDDLRSMLDGGKWSRDNEKFVLKMRDQIAIAALESGKHVIIDDTGFADFHESNLRALADACGAKFQIQDFTHISIETCIERDLKRQRSVGESVIRGMWRKYLAPKPAVQDFDPRILSAYLCDLDGTLCIANGRDYYDGSKCDTDLPNVAVVHTIRQLLLRGEQVIFASGRMESARDKSIEWLKLHVFSGMGSQCSPTLFMRADGDQRNDGIVKTEIYERYIKPNWNIIAVFDDRQRVVDAWRQLGLTVFQVADGDF